ncbi:hypothetical protein C5167_049938 [Papaver somniferum]|uniref:Uncharacterized protein n=1 Tax=Papaver somniferum TaxID=3469 RepID=A0A4Y7KQ33_PAPSO|nr:hypothetical protein C5167_049938 [Papaver somniferum]
MQSFHTTIQAPDKSPLELQIRTQVVHSPATWLYKESEKKVSPSRVIHVPKGCLVILGHDPESVIDSSVMILNLQISYCDPPDFGVGQSDIRPYDEQFGRKIKVCRSSAILPLGLPYYAVDFVVIFGLLRQKVQQIQVLEVMKVEKKLQVLIFVNKIGDEYLYLAIGFCDGG